MRCLRVGSRRQMIDKGNLFRLHGTLLLRHASRHVRFYLPGGGSMWVSSDLNRAKPHKHCFHTVSNSQPACFLLSKSWLEMDQIFCSWPHDLRSASIAMEVWTCMKRPENGGFCLKVCKTVARFMNNKNKIVAIYNILCKVINVQHTRLIYMRLRS